VAQGGEEVPAISETKRADAGGKTPKRRSLSPILYSFEEFGRVKSRNHSTKLSKHGASPEMRPI